MKTLNNFWRLILSSLLVAGIIAGIPTGTTRATGPSFSDSAFYQTWQQDDFAVANGFKGRTWTWGPEPLTSGLLEPYTDSPQGQRQVQYFDKSRMEITNPSADRSSPWYVTNGLLVREMVSGQIQLGDNKFETRQPAEVPVAGDGNSLTSPTYKSFKNLIDKEPVPGRLDDRVDETLSRDGTVGKLYAPPTQYAPLYAVYVGGHNVPNIFWDFTSRNYGSDRWLFVFGLPVSEAYWIKAKVGGIEKDMLVQLFERRVLTYTPSNDPQWQVEMGNVGQHYYSWRYNPNTPAETVGTAEGFSKLAKADGGKICAATRFQFMIQVGVTVKVTWPECDSLQLSGNGLVKILLKPDPTGYGVKELMWSPKEISPQVTMSVLAEDGVTWSGQKPLSTFSKGIAFGGPGLRQLEVIVTNGSMTLSLVDGHGQN